MSLCRNGKCIKEICQPNKPAKSKYDRPASQPTDDKNSYDTVGEVSTPADVDLYNTPCVDNMFSNVPRSTLQTPPLITLPSEQSCTQCYQATQLRPYYHPSYMYPSYNPACLQPLVSPTYHHYGTHPNGTTSNVNGSTVSSRRSASAN